jgi:adenylyl-sulfate kinase
MNNESGFVIWLEGLSGSGKSTLANILCKILENDGHKCLIIDGDDFRTGVSSDLGFSNEHRSENIRRGAEVAKLIASQGIIVICAFITPHNSNRELIRLILQGFDFVEIFVNVPLQVCQKRDSKGLYNKVNHGLIKNFSGIDSVFETPLMNDFIVDNDLCRPEENARAIFEYIRFRKFI